MAPSGPPGGPPSGPSPYIDANMLAAFQATMEASMEARVDAMKKDVSGEIDMLRVEVTKWTNISADTEVVVSALQVKVMAQDRTIGELHFMNSVLKKRLDENELSTEDIYSHLDLLDDWADEEFANPNNEHSKPLARLQCRAVLESTEAKAARTVGTSTKTTDTLDAAHDLRNRLTEGTEVPKVFQSDAMRLTGLKNLITPEAIREDPAIGVLKKGYEGMVLLSERRSGIRHRGNVTAHNTGNLRKLITLIDNGVAQLFGAEKTGMKQLITYLCAPRGNSFGSSLNRAASAPPGGAGASSARPSPGPT